MTTFLLAFAIIVVSRRFARRARPVHKPRALLLVDSREDKLGKMLAAHEAYLDGKIRRPRKTARSVSIQRRNSF